RDGSPGRGVRRVLLGAAGRLGSDGRGPPQGAGEALRAPREDPGTSCRPGVPGSGASGGGPRGRSEGGGARGTGAAHRRTLEAGRRVHRGTMTPTSRTARPTKSKKRVAGPPKAAPPAVKIEAIELVSGGRPHPALGVGLWALGRWTTEDEARTKATIGRAYERGFRWFDTAEVYGNGRSERVLGEVLARAPGTAPDAYVVTKVSWEHLRANQVRASLIGSLERLARRSADLC